MNEVELHAQKQRGIRAKQILDDELIKKAFHDIRESIFDKIAQSSFKQQDDREDCYRMLRAIESFEGKFKQYINTGKVAEDKLNPLMKVVKRVQEI